MSPRRSDTDALPEPPWREKRPSPRVRLSRESIVQAAITVLDRDGLKNLSMRTVATELDTGPGSLYWHVQNKEELLDLVFDELIGEAYADLQDVKEAAEANPADWVEQFVQQGLGWRRVLLRHPDLCLVTLSRIPIGPNYLRAREWFLDFLRRAGVSTIVISVAVDAVQLFITSFVATETQLQHMGGKTMPRDEAERLLREYYRELPEDRFPNIRELADVLTGRSEERFILGLRALLSGLAVINENGTEL